MKGLETLVYAVCDLNHVKHMNMAMLKAKVPNAHYTYSMSKKPYIDIDALLIL